MAQVAFSNGGEPESFAMDVDFDGPTPDLGFGEHGVYGDYSQRAFSGMETPADTAFARTKREEENVLQIIRQASALSSLTVDLSGKHLMAIPDELTQMEKLEFLYLEGNEISFLPDEFFNQFPKLKWLDLRNNRLTRLPSIYLGGHACLRNLLLQNNNLKSLPLELGQVKTLRGLNITNNPLEFPPQDVIDQGIYEIQKFLRDMIAAKSSAKTMNVKDDMLDSIFEDSCDSSSSDDWNTNASMMELARQKSQRRIKKSLSADTASNVTGAKTSKTKLAPLPMSAEIQRKPSGYSELKKITRERMSKASASLKSVTPAERKPPKQPSIMDWKVNPYPEPPPEEYVAFKMTEERQLAKVRDRKSKTDAILQRRKDESMLRNWRDDAKQLRAQKQYQNFTKGTKEYPETAEDAPFAVDKPYMKMPNNAERLKESKEKPRRALSPASRARIEEEKAAKIRELEHRIKDHTAKMADRRRKPKGSPQEEMDAAKRELEVAEDLHRQLMQRHKNVDHRLKDFEAEVHKNFPTGTRLKH